MSRDKLEFSLLRAAVGAASYRMGNFAERVARAGITRESFANPHHALLWAAIVEGAERETFQPAVIWHSVQTLPVDDLTSLFFDTPDSDGFDDYLRALRDIDDRTKLGAKLAQIRASVGDATKSTDSTVTELIDLAEVVGFSRTPRTADDFIAELEAEIDSNTRGGLATILTGVGPLDKAVGGLQPTLMVIGAESGVGKSALSAGIIRNLAKRGLKVGLISLEDESRWIFRRFLAYETGIPVMVLQTRRLTSEQQARFQNAANDCMSWMRNVVCRDRTPMSAKQIIGEMRAMISEGCRAVFLDHLGEVAVPRTQRHDLDLSDALREIRNLAKHARIPLVVVSHLKRREGMREPSLTDFAETAGLERMARVALGLWRNEHGLICTVLKCTNGISNVNFALNFDANSSLVINSPVADGLESRIDNAYRDRKA